MHPARFTCIMILVATAASTATATLAEGYTYKPPASPAATQALQTPAQKTLIQKTLAKAPESPVNLQKQTTLAAIDTTPGLIRPATRIADWPSRDDDHRGFVCVDKKCKTQAPVYKSRTPLEQEQGLGNN